MELNALRRSLRPSDNSDFWLQILPTDLLLLERVADGRLTAAEQDTIVQGYITTWQHVGTVRELSSVREQLDFLIAVLEDVPQQAVLLDALKSMLQRLEQAKKN